ncbi:MAG: hypothetical protein VKJ24_12540, partial [Synechococcales bacterium]|nr:hypothetical protein [Synechococcales bacterium]
QVLEQAQQGNPDAIAALINRQTKPQGVDAKAARKENRLQILLEGLDLPNERLSTMVSQGVHKLGLNTILQVYGRQVGQETMAWIKAFQISPEGVDGIEDEIILQECFGEGDPKVLARQGDLTAIRQYIEQSVAPYLEEQAAKFAAEGEAEAKVQYEIQAELEDGLLRATIMTNVFLDGPAFAAFLGKKLNAIASPIVKEFELYKQKNPSLPPFFIQKATLDPSLQSRL